eukprot:ANDGO_06618.mRNA.1 hypothetical protein GUITHDRAFT_92634
MSHLFQGSTTPSYGRSTSPDSVDAGRPGSVAAFYNPAGADLPFLPGFTYSDPRKLHHGRKTTLSRTQDGLLNINEAPRAQSALGSRSIPTPGLSGNHNHNHNQNSSLSHQIDRTKTPLLSSSVIGQSASRGVSSSVSPAPSNLSAMSSSTIVNAAGENFLSFLVYTVERVHEGNPTENETHRIRNFKLNLYLNDGSVELLERRDKNSGISAGAFLKRHKPSQNVEVLTPEKLNIGSSVDLYGVRYTVYAVAQSTREYLTQVCGFSVPADTQPPEDPYLQKRKADDNAHETGRNIPGYKYDDFKRFAEGALGFPSHLLGAEDSLKNFLANDGKVLKFLAAWDNRTEMFGRIQYFIVLYFLADNTCQVITTPGPEAFVGKTHAKREPLATLAKRGRLPKKFAGLSSMARRTENEFITPEDFYPGKSIDVYGRNLVVLDCDAFTRRYMSEKGLWVSYSDEDSVELVSRFLGASHPAKTFSREVPPHNNFGSEADSLGNVLRLVPKPPRVDIGKLLDNDGKILRFELRLVPTYVEDDDEERLFVLHYYLADDSIQVVEQRQRNSGRLGGTFLKRSKVPEIASYRDIVPGSRIVLYSQAFDVLCMDEYSKNYLQMLNSAGGMTATSWNGRLEEDPEVVHGQVATKLLQANRDLRTAFRSMDADKDALITVDEFENWLKRFDFRITDLCLVKLVRRFDANGDGIITFDEFVGALQPYIMVTVNLKDAFAHGDVDWNEYALVLSNAERGKNARTIINRILSKMSEILFVRRSHFTEALYREFDCNRDGFVDAVEFEQSFARLGIKLLDSDRDTVIEFMFNGDRNTPLDYRTFLARLSYYRASLDAANPMSNNCEVTSTTSGAGSLTVAIEPLDPVFPGASPKRSTSRLQHHR